jgi:hypothetical protein
MKMQKEHSLPKQSTRPSPTLLLPSLFNAEERSFEDFDDHYIDAVEELIKPAKANSISVEEPFVYVATDRPVQSQIPATLGGYTLIVSHKRMPYHRVGCAGMGPEIDKPRLRRYTAISNAALDETISLFSTFEPHCVMTFGYQCIVALAPRPDDVFTLLLRKLPSQIGELLVFYMNGPPMLISSSARTRKIQPSRESLVCDETDYLPTLSPGVCFFSKTENGEVRYYTTSGVLVTNEAGDIRLTSAAHGMEGSTGILYHANTPIADLDCILPDSNICLLRLRQGVNYTNDSYFTVDGVGETLFSIHHLPPWNVNAAYSDSYVSGPQVYTYLGKIRWALCPEPEFRSVGFVRLTQSILYRRDMVEGSDLGACGAPIVTSLKADGSRGILGFHHYCDVLDPAHRDRTLFTFAQTTDPLIDNGWKVLNVQVGNDISNTHAQIDTPESCLSKPRHATPPNINSPLAVTSLKRKVESDISEDSPTKKQYTEVRYYCVYFK